MGNDPPEPYDGKEEPFAWWWKKGWLQRYFRKLWGSEDVDDDTDEDGKLL